MQSLKTKILDDEDAKLELKNNAESYTSIKISNDTSPNFAKNSQQLPVQVRQVNDIFQLTRQELPNPKRMTIKLNTIKSLPPNRRASQLKTSPQLNFKKITSNQMMLKNTSKVVDQINDGSIEPIKAQNEIELQVRRNNQESKDTSKKRTC